MAKIVGLATLRASSSPILALNMTGYSRVLKYYADTLRSVAPTELDLSSLDDAISSVETAAHTVENEIAIFHARLEEALRKKSRRRVRRAFKLARSINRRLKTFERGFIDEKGLEGREWYKHLGVAPGKWLGYGATTFPGVTEAITIDGDLDKARRELERLVVKLRGVGADLLG
jgi:N-acetylated-alpha-linked acidic dipeptidase